MPTAGCTSARSRWRNHWFARSLWCSSLPPYVHKQCSLPLRSLAKVDGVNLVSSGLQLVPGCVLCLQSAPSTSYSLERIGAHQRCLRRLSRVWNKWAELVADHCDLLSWDRLWFFCRGWFLFKHWCAPHSHMAACSCFCRNSRSAYSAIHMASAS